MDGSLQVPDTQLALGHTRNASGGTTTSGPTTQDLMAVADGTVVKIFDMSTLLSEKKECQHIRTVRPVPAELELDLDDVSCSACRTKSENWMCLVCHEMFCGRYQNSHMLEHFRDTGHCVSMSLADLSVWCYGCDMYLQHEFFPLLHRFFSRLHQLKFDEKPQNVKHLDDDQMLPLQQLFDDHAFACPDVAQVKDAFLKFESFDASCATCKANNVVDSGNRAFREDWMCLICGGVYCGRYHHKHALHHFQLTSHSLSLSLIDLSIWCYSCMQYVDHNDSPALTAAYNHVRSIRGAESPNAAELAAVVAASDAVPDQHAHQ